MKFNDLQSWLSWQEKLHLTEIDLGLERIQKVACQLELTEHWSVPVVTVAGTNGKGSSVAFLEAFYKAAGYRVGSYTSPHLLRYNERIRINSSPVSDQQIIHAFQQVEDARQACDGISLTYFEFGTLAALVVLNNTELDLLVLEVGLGGRLDAVNIVDADIALITPVALDHQGWLGDTREQIAAEKAGIIKPSSQVVCSDPDPAEAIIDVAAQLQRPLYCLNKDFSLQQVAGEFQFENAKKQLQALPAPALFGDYQLGNAAACIQVTELLQSQLPIDVGAIAEGLQTVKLAGRYQIIEESPRVIVDVAHNEHAVSALADNLRAEACDGRTFAIVAMLDDKAICDAIQVIDDEIDRYFLAGLEGSRALTAEQMQTRVQSCVSSDKLQLEETVGAALQKVKSIALTDDRIIIFGSFLTVAAALEK